MSQAYLGINHTFWWWNWASWKGACRRAGIILGVKPGAARNQAPECSSRSPSVQSSAVLRMTKCLVTTQPIQSFRHFLAHCVLLKNTHTASLIYIYVLYASCLYCSASSLRMGTDAIATTLTSGPGLKARPITQQTAKSTRICWTQTSSFFLECDCIW